VAAIAAAAATAAACSAFSAGSPPDTAEAGVDAAADGAVATSDAQSDAQRDALDQGPCARFLDATLCDDFNAASINGQWQVRTTVGGNPADAGNLQLVSEAFSPPRAVAVLVPSSGADAGFFGASSLALKVAAKKQLRVRGSYKVTSQGSDFSYLVSFERTSQGGYFAVRVLRFSGGAVVLSVVTPGDGGPVEARETILAEPLTDWTDLDLDVQLSPASVAAALTVGVKTVSLTADVAVTAPTMFTVDLGIASAYVPPAGGDTRVVLDDVAMWNDP
jgi:hypothetical protein